jgi:predicted DNA-binding protein
MPENREIAISIRLNDEEARRLDGARRTIGLDRSAYIRMALLEKLNLVAPPSPRKPQPSRKR